MPHAFSRPLRAVLCLAVLLPATGCRMIDAPSNHYMAANLPEELQAKAYDNPRHVNWTKIAQPDIGSQAIAAGDVIEVSIAAGLSSDGTITWPVRVHADDGLARLPRIGTLPLAGLTLEAAEAAISEACIERGLFWEPNVTVTMKQQYKNRVMVIGGVKEPGVYDLPHSRSNLLGVIHAASGLSGDAGSNIEILSSGRDPMAAKIRQAGYSLPESAQPRVQVVRINLVNDTQSGSAQFYVPDGATVVIEKRDPEPIHVQGLVKKPNRYDFPYDREVTVLDAIAMAGGVTSSVADKVFVIRARPKTPGESVVIELSRSEAKRDSAVNVRLQPGDRVTVEHTPATMLLEAIKIIRFGIGASISSLL